MAHLFLDDGILREVRHEHTAYELFLRNILRRGEACFTVEDMFSVHSCHLWGGIILVLSVSESIKSASVAAFGLELSGTLLWAPICYLID
jgi:hypothetical protein